jgi:hypothetical protein
VEDSQDNHGVGAAVKRVAHDVGCAGDDELTRARHSTRAAQARLLGKKGDLTDDSISDAARCARVVLEQIIEDFA